LNEFILDGSSPKRMRLIILNYGIELLENEHLKFSSEEIEGYINKLGEIEDLQTLEGRI
jgi:hypothetical protein